MAQELLLETFAEIDRGPHPTRPGATLVRYDYTVRTWDTSAKYVEGFTDIWQHTGGYPGAPDEPRSYSRPLDLPADAYTVPGPGQFGHIAGREGEYTTIFHDGAGDVTRTYAPRCDLRVFNILARAPVVAGGLGAVEFDVSTRAASVRVHAESLAGQGGTVGTSLVNVAPGRLAIQQLPPGRYVLYADDANDCFTDFGANLEFTVPPFTAAPPPAVRGCTDEDASNYNPLATVNDGSCVYTPRWSALWAPEGMPVAVAPTAGPAGTPLAYVSGEVYAGYPASHPFAGFRPQVKVADVRATVSPRTGVAEFNLAPYLRGQVGALQSDGSRRLDLNSSEAQLQDLFVCYRLVVGGRAQASGYALNSALASQQLAELPDGAPLTPFGRTLPVWPGYDYFLSHRKNHEDGRGGFVARATPQDIGFPAKRLVYLPCPRYGLPVAWLAPEGGYGYWVFSGNHSHGDEVAEGQAYAEAGTGELRYSSRNGSRRTLEASSGVFSQRAFAEGLRTLRRAVQAWYQPGGPGTAWVPIVLRSGSFPAYREGRHRYEVTIQFSEAAVAVQGQ